jgi:SPP1 gp7 family putative phage head morphogenesis protein
MNRKPSETAELARLRSQNARLTVDARRYQQLRRAQQRAPAAKKAAIIAPPFQLVDPRRASRAGTKVLQALTPPLVMAQRMSAAIVGELRAMAVEARALVRALAALPGAAEQTTQALDAIPNDARASLDALQLKWQKRFDILADAWSRRMVGAVIEQSDAQMNIGLKELAEREAIQATMATPRMYSLLEAAVQSSVGLIARIPERFLGGVQTAVMNAITTGSGLADLVPYLTKKYQGDARHAHLVALDQVRKVSESVNAARMQELGSEEYVWIATGGERYPRKLHHETLNGRTFRYDDPPVIDEHTGERGIPGQLPFCRCRARPVVNFMKMRERIP